MSRFQELADFMQMPLDLVVDHEIHEWAFLMYVVEKIEKLDYGFKMCRKVVEVYIDSTKEIILHVKKSSREESLVEAIVQFLDWYYKQIKK